MYCSHKNSNIIWLVISSDTNEARQPCTEYTSGQRCWNNTDKINNKILLVDTTKEVGKTFQYYVHWNLPYYSTTVTWHGEIANLAIVEPLYKEHFKTPFFCL